MSDASVRHGHPRLHPSRWTYKTYLGTAALLALVIFLSPKGFIELALINQEGARLESRKQLLEAEAASLDSEVAHFHKSLVAKERAIREELGYLKEDELSLEIMPADKSGSYER